MLMHRFTAATAVIILAVSGLSAPPAFASFVMTLKPVGSNIIAAGSGSFNLNDLSPNAPILAAPPLIAPSFAEIASGTSVLNGALFDFYWTSSGFTGPTSFGSGTSTDAGNSSGDNIEFGDPAFANILFLLLPHGYTSGELLSTTATFTDADFTSLGVTPGTYVWTWGSGPDQSFTLDAVNAVPEPPAFGLFALGLVFIGIVRQWSRGQKPD